MRRGLRGARHRLREGPTLARLGPAGIGHRRAHAGAGGQDVDVPAHVAVPGVHVVGPARAAPRAPAFAPAGAVVVVDGADGDDLVVAAGDHGAGLAIPTEGPHVAGGRHDGDAGLGGLAHRRVDRIAGTQRSAVLDEREARRLEAHVDHLDGLRSRWCRPRHGPRHPVQAAEHGGFVAVAEGVEDAHGPEACPGCHADHASVVVAGGGDAGDVRAVPRPVDVIPAL